MCSNIIRTSVSGSGWRWGDRVLYRVDHCGALGPWWAYKEKLFWWRKDTQN